MSYLLYRCCANQFNLKFNISRMTMRPVHALTGVETKQVLKEKKMKLKEMIQTECGFHKQFLFRNHMLHETFKTFPRNQSLFKMFSIRKVKAESINNVGKPKTFVSEREINDYISKETGMDRLKKAFDFSNGRISPEIGFYVTNYAGGSTAQLLLAVSSVFMLHKNRKQFQALKLPREKFFREVFLKSLKDAVKYTAIGFSVIAVFFGITETIAVYRNKTSPFEFGLAGGVIAGLTSLYQLKKYPQDSQNQKIKTPKLYSRPVPRSVFRPVPRSVFVRNYIVGCTLFGLLFGVFYTFEFKRSNLSQEQRHFWHVQQCLTEAKERHLKDFE